MARKRTIVGQGSTENIDKDTGLTPTETLWLKQARKHIDELNLLLEERGSTMRFGTTIRHT